MTRVGGLPGKASYRVLSSWGDSYQIEPDSNLNPVVSRHFPAKRVKRKTRLAR